MQYFRKRSDATAALKADREKLAATLAARVPALVKAFDGAIKYAPMLKDHPDWSDKDCVAFARKWHAVAIERLRAKDPAWNNGIPYSRNIPTPAMLKEAGK